MFSLVHFPTLFQDPKNSLDPHTKSQTNMFDFI